jgi:hypothetical protein
MAHQNLHKESADLPWGGETRAVSSHAELSGELFALPSRGRMPVVLPTGKAIRLRLAHQWFHLKRIGDEVVLEEDGDEHILKAGLNVIGRAPDADVRVAIDCQDVSRHHVVIDVRDGDIVVLKDTSSCGTFVGSEAFYD